LIKSFGLQTAIFLLLVPAMAVTFAGLLFAGMFWREEWMGMRMHLGRRKG